MRVMFSLRVLATLLSNFDEVAVHSKDLPIASTNNPNIISNIRDKNTYSAMEKDRRRR